MLIEYEFVNKEILKTPVMFGLLFHNIVVYKFSQKRTFFLKIFKVTLGLRT
jgi:hypothetical protein